MEMVGQSKTTTAARRKPPAPKPADVRDELSLKDLARGILSKEIRSRAVDVRRLAEAVLAGGAKPKKAGKADGGKKKDKSKKKLAKIPGQQKK
jgi:hypothetical protein